MNDSSGEETITENWPYNRDDLSVWQRMSKSVRDRSEHLFESREMSDVGILAVDENWWFGNTVKDFYGHKFLLGSASPVLHHILYEMEFSDTSKEIILNLDPKLSVTLSLTKTYDSEKLELNGIPPIAASSLLEYIYKDKFRKSDFENGYSRNLLWRLWHASKALEMDHLAQITSETIDETMNEDTVFWDLNYSMTYNEMGLDHIKDKVLKIMDNLDEKLFEHPNFVWIEHAGIAEILNKRRPGNCEPLIILNNLLRWVLYQMDRVACCEIDEKTGSDIPIEHRLKWIRECRNGDFPNVEPEDLEKYLRRGLEKMPWTEFSQEEFLKYLPENQLLNDETLLSSSLQLMRIVVNNPHRIKYSEHGSSVFLLNPSVKDNKETMTKTEVSSKKSIREICLLEMMEGENKEPESLISI